MAAAAQGSQSMSQPSGVGSPWQAGHGANGDASLRSLSPTRARPGPGPGPSPSPSPSPEPYSRALHMVREGSAAARASSGGTPSSTANAVVAAHGHDGSCPAAGLNSGGGARSVRSRTAAHTARGL